jgi:hypothetical protein
VNDEELKQSLFSEQCCPHCGSTGFLDGPCGGLSQNIMCAVCGAKFNICPPFFAQSIGNPNDGWKNIVKGCLIVRKECKVW